MLGFALFGIVRALILRPDTTNLASERALLFMPFLYGATAILIVFLVIYKGSPQLGLANLLTWYEATIISVVCGVVTAIAVAFMRNAMRRWSDNYGVSQNSFAVWLFCPNRATMQTAMHESNAEMDVFSDDSSQERLHEPQAQPLENAEDKREKAESTSKDEEVQIEKVEAPSRSWLSRLLNAGQSSEQVEELHSRSEVFYEKDEILFSLPQVLSACMNSFAHGANDVANSVGPFSAIIAVSQSGQVLSSSAVPVWVLAFGGAGLVAGLAMWGWKVILTLGGNISKVTASRGFTAEYASTCTVLAASRLGIPVSSTHCQVGAVSGIGLLDGVKNVNWRLLSLVAFSWLLTLPLAAVSSAIIYVFLRGVLAISI
jgi:phosphate/sulfate permease